MEGVIAAAHLASLGRQSSAAVEATLSARLQRVEALQQSLVATARLAADRVASWPETRDALGGDAAALAALFTRLDRDRGGVSAAPSLAVHAADGGTLAWAGRIEDRHLSGDGPDAATPGLSVTGNGVSTRLRATAPILDASGALRGLASAEIALAERRNIHGGSLGDFDRLADVAPGIEVRYVDPLDRPRPLPPAPAGDVSRETILRAPGGAPLAVVRATNRGSAAEYDAAVDLHRRIASGLLVLAFTAWVTASPVPPIQLALGAVLLRGALLLLGPPVPAPGSTVLQAAAYASTSLFGLLRSPLDLALTAAALLVLSTLALRAAVGRPPGGSPWLALAADAANALLLAGMFHLLAEACTNSPLPVEVLSPDPRGWALATLQAGLLAALSGTALLMTSLLVATTAVEAGTATMAGRLARSALIVAMLAAARPALRADVAWLPALGLLLLVAAGAARLRGMAVVNGLSVAKVTAAVVGVAGLSTVLAMTLSQAAARDLRWEIERTQAPQLLRQPEWRRYVLDAARNRIDELSVLEETGTQPHPPLLEELAFSIWSETDLAGAGLPSAVEIQDATGFVVSRFAIGLPTPPNAASLPDSDAWQVARERLPLASAERFALHARRRLTYHGQVHGAVHVYVADDLQALPAAAGRDPYSALFMSATPAPRDRPSTLVAWSPDRTLLFTTADRPPALDAALAARVLARPQGLWAELPIDGAAHDAYLFSDGRTLFALAYERRGPSRIVADLLEALSAGLLLFTLLAAAVLLLRSALRRPSYSWGELAQAIRSRFSLRLFVAFVAAAFLPVIVLNTVVRAFVAERLRREAEDQALDLAAVAKKAVEDFAFFQRGESPGHEPVTDAALVWVSSLIRNDLDVFEGGRLIASSKRELYASGLLPDRVSGTVFRAVALEGQPSALRAERIGSLSYQVVSVPVQLESLEPAILSIPLALREREVQEVLDDLDRSIRLASMLFLSAAALLAFGVARRISEPLHDLTEATRRVAAGDLEARVTTASQDEFRALVDSFNQMAGDLAQQRGELERSNRLAAWAEMARQVAHEVKNPLTPIQLATEHLRRVYADRREDFGATLDSCTDTILKQVRTLRGIVTEFSSFARPAQLEASPIDFAGLVAGAARPYEGILPPQVRLTLDAPAIPGVRGDRRLLERAVVNLIENALQAVGERGSVEIRVRAEGGMARVEVVDSGPGLDAEARRRLFQPFFSTKTGGSGLGLALVRKIAQDHGGGASLESEPGQTRATLWLPLASA